MAKQGGGLGSGTVQWVCIDDMDRDPMIQRELDLRAANRIAAEFDPDAFGIPTLSLRKSGRYVIVDAQTRIEALRIMGWNGQKVQCEVFTGLTQAQEAGLFRKRNDFRAVRYIDKFLVRLTEHDAVALAIAKVVQDADYVVDRKARDGVITAAKAIEDIYLGRGQRVKGHNPKALRRTLDVVTAAWGRTTASVNGRVLSGIGAFFLRYGDAIDVQRLVNKLARTTGGPTGLVSRGAGKRELHGGTIASGIAHYLTDEYNRGIRGSKRFTGWRESEDA